MQLDVDGTVNIMAYKMKRSPAQKKIKRTKISGPCKSAAKRKFKVWPSAYASGWGVRCTRAGGPSKWVKRKSNVFV